MRNVCQHRSPQSRIPLFLGWRYRWKSIRSNGPAVHRNNRAIYKIFYPGNATQLKKAVEAYLNDGRAPRPDRPLALIAPHAGYVFSGQIAADAYRQAMGHEYDLVVILGTNHTTPGFEAVSVYPGYGYRTPLGVMEIDEAFEAMIASQP